MPAVKFVVPAAALPVLASVLLAHAVAACLCPAHAIVFGVTVPARQRLALASLVIEAVNTYALPSRLCQTLSAFVLDHGAHLLTLVATARSRPHALNPGPAPITPRHRVCLRRLRRGS